MVSNSWKIKIFMQQRENLSINVMTGNWALLDIHLSGMENEHPSIYLTWASRWGRMEYTSAERRGKRASIKERS